MTLKEAYLKQAPATIKPKKIHDGDVEECDQDYTKKPSVWRLKKETVRKVYIEKKEFTWGPAQEASFNAIKEAIANNAMAGSAQDTISSCGRC